MTSKVVYKGNLRTQCIHLQSGSEINTDAPTDNNGKGELFSPTDTVATGLASCMITVMGIKAEQSDIAFNNISADVLKVMKSNPRQIGEIHITFHIQESWNDKEKAIMERTAFTCPVAKSLHPDLKQEIIFNYS